jgi:hypothetical protein
MKEKMAEIDMVAFSIMTDDEWRKVSITHRHTVAGRMRFLDVTIDTVRYLLQQGEF